jgi:hypothetical protein
MEESSSGAFVVESRNYGIPCFPSLTLSPPPPPAATDTNTNAILVSTYPVFYVLMGANRVTLPGIDLHNDQVCAVFCMPLMIA